MAPSPKASPTKASGGRAHEAAAQLEDASAAAVRTASAIWDALPGDAAASDIARAFTAYHDQLVRLREAIAGDTDNGGAEVIAGEANARGATNGARGGTPHDWTQRIVPRAFLEALDACDSEGGQPDRALAVLLGDLEAASARLSARASRQCLLADRLARG